MIPCLYASTEMKFNHNGIGKLADAQSCTVTEKRNGSYELKLVCPADGIHAEMLEEGNIILAKPSDTISLSRSASTRSRPRLMASWKCRHGIFPTSSTLSRYHHFQ